MAGFRNAYNISVGIPEGKRSIRRPTRRWEEGTIINFKT
jgi:hypothetical protein